MFKFFYYKILYKVIKLNNFIKKFLYFIWKVVLVLGFQLIMFIKDGINENVWMFVFMIGRWNWLYRRNLNWNF